MYIIVKKGRVPRFREHYLAGNKVLVPGIGSMEPQERREVLAAIQEKHGVGSETEYETQRELREKKLYGKHPSVKRYWQTADEAELMTPEERLRNGE